METIKLERNNGSIELMSLDVFSRWMCLVEAFHFIEETAKQRNIDDITTLLKPIAIEKYIEERYASMRHDVECEHLLGLI